MTGTGGTTTPMAKSASAAATLHPAAPCLQLKPQTLRFDSLCLQIMAIDSPVELALPDAPQVSVLVLKVDHAYSTIETP